MGFFTRLSPIRAINDLRGYLAQRHPIEVVFLFLAIVATTGLLFVFARDSDIKRGYKQEVVYVAQWSADRTDAQIKAQQVIDQAAKEQREAELDARRRAKQAEWKRLDDKLKAYGI